jgi:hypothetical protein
MRYLGIDERTVLFEPMITKYTHTISAPNFETLIEKVRAIHELPNLHNLKMAMSSALDRIQEIEL